MDLKGGDEERGQRLGVQISSRVGDSVSTALGQAGGNQEGPYGEEDGASGGPGMNWVAPGRCRQSYFSF